MGAPSRECCSVHPVSDPSHPSHAELNVLVGLCVGRDSLFFRYSEAPVTVLMVKDRVTGHNPAAALYTSESYYRRLRKG